MLVVVYFICLLTISFALAIVLATALASILFSVSLSSVVPSVGFSIFLFLSSGWVVFIPAGSGVFYSVVVSVVLCRLGSGYSGVGCGLGAGGI